MPPYSIASTVACVSSLHCETRSYTQSPRFSATESACVLPASV